MDKQDERETKNASSKREQDDQDDHLKSDFVKVEQTVTKRPKLTKKPSKGTFEQGIGENPVLVVPPNASSLSPIHKLILVDLWSDDKKVVRKALQQVAECLCCMHEECVNNITIFHRAGGASTIVGAMRRWYIVPDIQAHGCLALANAFIETNNSDVHPNEAGASEAITNAMKNYPYNRDVLMNGCRALASLCYTMEQGAYIVNTMKGHDVILTTMKIFSNDAEIQAWTCYALSYLSETEKCRAPICDAGGFQALLDTIETHKDESKEHVGQVQKFARRAIKNCFSFKFCGAISL
jgi:hypothetical protein